jgi:uncharacterized protein (DUF1778 family)
VSTGKKKGGEAATPKKVVKDQNVHIRLTVATKARVEAAAAKREMTVSNWLLQAALDKLVAEGG